MSVEPAVPAFLGGGRIRRGSMKDLATFRSNWHAFLIRQAAAGSPVEPDESALYFYEQLFTAYAHGSKRGVCLFLGLDLGCLLWGESLVPSPFTMKGGPVAHGWGIYLNPSVRGHGYSRLLRERAADELRAMGIGAVIGGMILPPHLAAAIEAQHPRDHAPAESALGVGFRLIEAVGWLDLTRPAAKEAA